MFGGGMVLLGWSLGNEVLMQILPGLVAMNPFTALGFIAAGISLACYWLGEAKSAHSEEIGRAMGYLLVIMGVLKLGGYLGVWHLHFDRMLFPGELQKDGTGFKNEIAPNTAFNFALSGLALCFLHSPVRGFSRHGQNLSLALLFVSLVPIVGYIYQASFLYSIGAYIPMALHTAAFFLVLALGMLLAQTESGVVALFISSTPGGAMARRLLPFAFAVPILLGAMTMWVDRERFQAGEFGITIVVVGSSAIFTGLIWWNAILLNRADFQRRLAEEQLQQAHDNLELRVQERTAKLNEANVALLRSQRMESIGKLAGGIAHDLNNALTPVIMGAQLLKDNQSEAERSKLLETISSSANRGAAMVKHILTFARGSKGPNQQVPLSNLVKEIAKVIQDTFSKAIAINVKAGKELWNVSGDATELYQVLLNLCVNARDAMPQGGELTLTVENLKLSEKIESEFADIPAGDYVVLAVADTGSGIPPQVRPRIFEPLFTTKAPDKGTGLGLSTVAGIVKSHSGYIQVHTETGKGTKFRVYLPASKSLETDKSTELGKALPVGHGELILLMDDEATVRQLTQTTLQNCGYRVLTATSGFDGVTTFDAHKDEIKILVSDTDMPVMNGIVAIQAIQRLKPGIPVIITSGVERDKEQLASIDTRRLTILQKPYTVEQIVSAVAKELQSTVESAGASDYPAGRQWKK
ncbi:MAG TPA: ATP-binding protein [Candidatus Sulfopaludibacter sp.]|nr:ATP-binding protein [Candidatus Sulfopaludibacter sp.]